MAPQSRGSPVPGGLQSKSTPTLPTVRSLDVSVSEKPPADAADDATDSTTSRPSPVTNTSSGPSEVASVEDNDLPEHATVSLPAEEMSDSSSNEDESTFTST